MLQSHRLSLPYIAASQAQKHVTHNQALQLLDTLVQLTIQSRTEANQPATPSDGAAYILPTNASGTMWASFPAGALVVYSEGGWLQLPVSVGFRAYIVDEGLLLLFEGGIWTPLTGGTSSAASYFGINTDADEMNRLSVKSNAVLFHYDDVTPGTDDCQISINKQSPEDTASLVFQANAVGYAEIGLTGSNNFHIKTSSDGAIWRDALVVNTTSGKVGIGTNDPAQLLEIFKQGNNLLRVSGGPSSAVGFEFYQGPGKVAQVYGVDNEIRFVGDDVVRMKVNQGVIIGTPAGGDRGPGTINCQALYDDNILLSCYVFDQVLDGNIDEAKWDEKVPDYQPPELEEGELPNLISRQHLPMRDFKSRIGTQYDPVTLDGYARHWKEKRHLTALPNEEKFQPIIGQLATGAWIQRLIETVEIQAVLIEELNQRTRHLAI